MPDTFAEIPLGKAEVVRPPTADRRPPVAIWALGDMLPLAEQVADELGKKDIPAGFVNARFVKPLDTNLLDEQSKSTRLIVTIENGTAAGGFGSAVEEHLGEQGWDGRVLRIGWPDEFISHGNHEALLKQHGFTAEAIAQRAVAAL